MQALGIEITDKRRTLTALGLIPVIILATGFACNTQNWVSRINSILNEIGPAVQIVVSLLPLLSGKTIPSNVTQTVDAWVPKVQQDVTQLGALVQQYKDTLASDTSAQAKLNDALRLTAQDVTSVLPIFNVLDPAVQQKVTAIVTAVSAAVLSVENIIATVEGKQVSLKRRGTFVSDGKDFKTKFNATLHAPTGDKTVDNATAQLAI